MFVAQTPVVTIKILTIHQNVLLFVNHFKLYDEYKFKNIINYIRSLSLEHEILMLKLHHPDIRNFQKS